MRVFFDANVLFSAAKSDGAVRALVHRLLEAGHECWVDTYVTEEARRNLAVKGTPALHAFETLIARVHVAAAAPAGRADDADTRWLPQNDRPVLAAAIRLRCDALVTGDRTPFGAGYGQRFGGVAVHSPRSLAEWLLA